MNTDSKYTHLQRLKNLYILISLIFLSVIPLFWWEEGLVLSSGEVTTFIDLTVNNYYRYFNWNPKIGYPNIEYTQFITYLPFELARLMNFSKEISIKLTILAPYAIKPLIFYLSAIWLFGKINSIYCLTATFLYCISPLELIFGQGINRQYFMCAMPLLSISYIKLLNTNDNRVREKSIYLFLVGTMLLSPAMGNPPLTSSIIIILLAISIIYRRQLYEKYKIIVLLLILSILVNADWLIITYDYFISLYNDRILNENNNLNTWDPSAEGAIYKLFLFLGSWAFENDVYNPYWRRYYRLDLLLMALSPMVIIISSFIMKRNNNTYNNTNNNDYRNFALFLFLIGLITLFISKGSNPPFAYFFKLINEYIPVIGRAWRSPFSKLIDGYLFVISLCLIWALSVSLKNNPFKKYIWIMLAFYNSMFIYLGYNYINGDAAIKGIYTSNQISVPSSWDKMNRGEPNMSLRTILLPHVGNSIVHNWEHGIYSSTNMANLLYFHRYINNVELDRQFTLLHQTSSKIFDELPFIEAMYENGDFIKTLDFFGVSHIHFVQDIDWNSVTPQGNRVYPRELQAFNKRLERSIANSSIFNLESSHEHVKIYKRASFLPTLENTNNKYFDSNIIGVKSIDPDNYIFIFKINSSNRYRFYLNENYNKNWDISLLSNCDDNLQLQDIYHSKVGDVFNYWEFNISGRPNRLVKSNCDNIAISVKYSSVFHHLNYFRVFYIAIFLILIIYFRLFKRSKIIE
jgi:hypothetical protein